MSRKPQGRRLSVKVDKSGQNWTSVWNTKIDLTTGSNRFSILKRATTKSIVQCYAILYAIISHASSGVCNTMPKSSFRVWTGCSNSKTWLRHLTSLPSIFKSLNNVVYLVAIALLLQRLQCDDQEYCVVMCDTEWQLYAVRALVFGTPYQCQFEYSILHSCLPFTVL